MSFDVGKYNKIRNTYYNLKINDKDNCEEVWKLKLRNILESDIHNKPLGCKISNTHIKLNDIHLDTFYEAQILFAHTRWVNRFATWLKDSIESKINEIKEAGAEPEREKKILVIGYETYIEPLLFSLKDKVKDCQLDYGVYEEEKYIRSNEKTEPRIRYIERYEKALGNNSYDLVVFVCGISSTLGTFIKMRKKCFKGIEGIISSKSLKYYSIIQVLKKGDNLFDLGDGRKLSWKKEDNKIEFESKVKDKEEGFSVNYLVSVECPWYPAHECPLCFPESYDKSVDEECPIIDTSVTSVIPNQMIFMNEGDGKDTPDTQPHIDLFVKHKEEFYYSEYLYYNHIDRDDHHYKYYIRTNRLFRNIYLQDEKREFDKFLKNEKKKLDKFFEHIKAEIAKPNPIEKNKTNVENNDASSAIDKEKASENNKINIIIAPTHFSNELFPNAVNKHVFDGNAHVISFDPKKEYRSNFETKHSNIAYYFEQIVESASNKDIKFYFVDDQLITGSTFFRAKSLVASLMNKNNRKFEEFAGVIIMLNRNSNATKRDYIKDINKYFSLIDIQIPSLRNYGDSCPSCNIYYTTEEIVNCCALDSEAHYWMGKHYAYRVKSLTDASKENEKLKSKFKQRHFRRFYFENELWKNLKNNKSNSEKEYRKIYVDLLSKNNSFEYVVAILKAISGPFIYYRENAKKASLKTLIEIAEEFLKFEIKKEQRKYTIKLDGQTCVNLKNSDLYTFIVILINCLASVSSTYLLNTDRIEQLCNKVKEIKGADFLDFGKEGECDKFYSVILHAYKRIICGIAGEKRCEYFIEKLKEKIKNTTADYYPLYEAMYLESITIKDTKPIDKNDEKDIIEKYNNIANSIYAEMFEGKGKGKASGKVKSEKDNEQGALSFYYTDASMGEDRRHYLLKGTVKAELSEGITLDDISETSGVGAVRKRLDAIGYCRIRKEGDESGKKYFLIKLHNYTEQDIKEEKENKDKVLSKEMYLLIAFDRCRTSNALMLKKLRDMLRYRHSLTEEIRRDIDIGAIKSAIQAKVAGAVLLSDKTQSHGQSKDINNLYNFAKTKLENDFNDDDKRVDVYKAIDLLMNRLIAFGGARQIYENYYTNINISGSNPIFNSYGQKFDENTKLFYDLFNNYLKDIKSNDSKLKNFINKKELSIDVENALCNIFSCLKAPPQMVGDAGTETTPIFIIGLINVFICNAIKHNEDGVKINIKFAQDSSNNKCSISVINTILKKEQNKRDEVVGLTECFKQYFNKIKEANNGEGAMSIVMKKTYDGNEEKFISSLTINC